MSGPAGYVSAHGATSFSVTTTALQGAASTTLALETRALGSAADWTEQATDGTPAVGDVLTASGLTDGAALEWRLIETAGGTTYDGTHGIVVPATALWSTLTATITTALEGQSFAAANIYTGRQPPPNYADVVAVLRTLPERQEGGATNGLERWVFPVEVEFRVIVVDDDGSTHKATIETWQRRLEAGLHEKHAGDFPSVVGLESVRVEVSSKDEASGRLDEYEDEVRARAIVRFAVWRAR